VSIRLELQKDVISTEVGVSVDAQARHHPHCSRPCKRRQRRGEALGRHIEGLVQLVHNQQQAPAGTNLRDKFEARPVQVISDISGPLLSITVGCWRGESARKRTTYGMQR
jgi:hypothetical protein